MPETPIPHPYAPGDDSRCKLVGCTDPYNIDGTHDGYWTNERLAKVAEALFGDDTVNKENES